METTNVRIRLLIVFFAPVLSLMAETPLELINQYVTAMGQVTDVLKTAKDIDTATTALPQLRTAVSALDALKAKLRAAKFDQAILKEQGARMQEASGKQHTEITRIRVMPPVEQVLADALPK